MRGKRLGETGFCARKIFEEFWEGCVSGGGFEVFGKFFRGGFELRLLDWRGEKWHEGYCGVPCRFALTGVVGGNLNSGVRNRNGSWNRC